MTKTWWGPGPSAHARVIQPDETTGSRQNKEAEMTIQQREPVRLNGSVQVPTLPLADAPPARGAAVTSITAKFLAVFRVAVGFVFLWAFLDKTFGLGYATPSAKAWINGGSPTKGFLSGLAVHGRPAGHRPRADPRGRAADRGGERHRHDAVHVGGGVAAGQAHLGWRAEPVDQPDHRLPHHLRTRRDRRRPAVRRQHLGVRQTVGQAAVRPAQPLAALTEDQPPWPPGLGLVATGMPGGNVAPPRR